MLVIIMKYLIIDACTRKESRTKKLYQEYIKNIKGDISILKLYDLDICPFDEAMLNKRDNYIFNKDYSNKMFDLAKQFKEQDYIIVAAPYWDKSFPSILKIYFEHISVSGLTFGYGKNGLEGFCNAKEFLYLATCGGYVENNLGYELTKDFFDMLGIKKSKYFQIDGLDIDPDKALEIFNDKIKELKGI